MRFRIAAESLLIAVVAASSGVRAQDEDYGVDVSFPMHRPTVSNNYPWLPHNADPENNPTPEEYKGMVIQPLGDRNAEYNKMMDGCYERYSKLICDDYEVDRVAMNLRQPQSMQNYTELGFQKIKTPPEAWKLIQDFWQANKDKQKAEKWPKGNTYTNHWDSETRIVSVEDQSLRGGGYALKKRLWHAAKSTISEWTQEELTECSLYGVRVYTRGSMLSSHVDRLPLVSSAIINVDSDLEEPWPLEVIGHDGRAHNVTMEPGDMVLYESHSIIHGRPFPLKGNFVANLFVHFEPNGHSLRHGAGKDEDDPNTQYKKAVSRGLAGHESDHSGLPPYLIPGSPEEANWRKRHPNAKKAETKNSDTSTTGSMTTAAHYFAQRGEMGMLKKTLESHSDLLHAKDENGWTPFHEAIRGGSLEAARYLHEKGANPNQRTHNGRGGTALYFAHSLHGPDHPVSKWLMEIGAENIEPEL
eukprot:CAMPEP_0194047048 /NCGR_PEP_ID=MMETSP0009_2-20130614/23530_1 /TAXON_ID=210454 /ORGANISM="Grammatophora oceanica, Strain CCMP 410" /LENGTH=470 /DNA_ID=CAMNT_0038692561 /DNA_START=131 /DNA_END=1543 /DNA_ORIENTATION=-